MFKLWYHMIPFALLGLFSLVELGLTGEWVSASSYNTGKVGFALFVSIWTFLSLLAHWTFPFIVAGAWAAFTTLLWLIAAAVISSGSCADVDNGLGRTFRVCFSGYSRWNSMVAFAWLNFFFTAAVLGCIWWYAMKTKQVTWRDGIYGRSYYMKPTNSGVTGTSGSVGMTQTSPTRGETVAA